MKSGVNSKNGVKYIRVYIDTNYDYNNTYLMDNLNIVKNGTLIYCSTDRCTNYTEIVEPIYAVITLEADIISPTVLRQEQCEKSPPFISVHFFNFLCHIITILLLVAIIVLVIKKRNIPKVSDEKRNRHHHDREVAGHDHDTTQDKQD